MDRIKTISSDNSILSENITFYTCDNCVYVMINSYEYCRLCCDQCLESGQTNCCDCIYYKNNGIFYKKNK
jgi:hypothetical protein